MDVRYQRGEFNTFYAKMKIRLGGNGPNGQPHNIAFEKGDSVQYDGSVLKYAGMEIPVGPSLRSSISNGWFTMNEDEVNQRVAAVVPSRNVAKSQTRNTDLSRVQRRDDDAMETDHHDEDTVMNVSDRRPEAAADAHHPVGRNIRAEPRMITSATAAKRPGFKSKGLVINPDQIEEQEYIPVAQLRTSAKAKPVNMYSSDTTKAKRQIEEMEDAHHRGEGAIYTRRPRQQEEVTEQEGVTIRTTGKMDRSAPIEVDVGQEGDGEVVAQVRHTSKGTGNAEGVEVRDTSNIRAEKANGKTATKEVKIDIKMSPKLRMARRIDPDFPADWNFQGRLTDRLAAAKKHGATPQFLEALFAAEGDQMRKLLQKTFPKQFSE